VSSLRTYCKVLQSRSSGDKVKVYGIHGDKRYSDYLEEFVVTVKLS
jgi:hypothetical protein